MNRGARHHRYSPRCSRTALRLRIEGCTALSRERHHFDPVLSSKMAAVRPLRSGPSLSSIGWVCTYPSTIIRMSSEKHKNHRTRSVQYSGNRRTPYLIDVWIVGVRAGSPRGITRPGLPLIRTCPLGHTARHVMSSLRNGTLSGSQPVVGADTAPAVGRIDPRQWSPCGDAARAISSRYRSQTIGIGTEQQSCL
jgi:hypothetical protein